MKLYVLFEPVGFPWISTQLWIGLGLIMLLIGLDLIFSLYFWVVVGWMSIFFEDSGGRAPTEILLKMRKENVTS
jgi:hypothetical protein